MTKMQLGKWSKMLNPENLNRLGTFARMYRYNKEDVFSNLEQGGNIPAIATSQAVNKAISNLNGVVSNVEISTDEIPREIRKALSAVAVVQTKDGLAVKVPEGVLLSVQVEAHSPNYMLKNISCTESSEFEVLNINTIYPDHFRFVACYDAWSSQRYGISSIAVTLSAGDLGKGGRLQCYVLSHDYVMYEYPINDNLAGSLRTAEFGG